LQAYRTRILEELQSASDAVKLLEEKGEPSSDKLRDMRDMLTLLRNFEIKAEKGRRKDFKKIDSLLRELLDLRSKW